MLWATPMGGTAESLPVSAFHGILPHAIFGQPRLPPVVHLDCATTCVAALPATERAQDIAKGPRIKDLPHYSWQEQSVEC